jgi:two-component sensor histidine kinase
VRDIATMLLSDEPAGRVTTRFHLESTIVDIETAFPVSLLVNELITNALKHAFTHRDRGQLEITVHPLGDGRIALGVADDGPGGLTLGSLEANTSLGSTIIRNLVRQLDADIHIGNRGGCRVEVRFPARPGRSA